MSHPVFHKLPTRDPVGGGPLHVSELSSDESGVTLRGRFAIPAYARLDDEQANFLETFLRCRGTLNGVERQLGISYPTVRARLDALLDALDLKPFKDEVDKDKVADKKRKLLDQLERGEITSGEMKDRLKEVASK